MSLKNPLRFATGNLLFGPRGSADAWALYRLEMRSYAGLPYTEKVNLLGELSSLLYHLERDCQILRVTRPWSADAYVEAVLAECDPRFGHPDALDQFLEVHRGALGTRQVSRPETYLAVRVGEVTSIAERARDLTRQRSLRRMAKGLREALGLGDPRGISARELDRLRRNESEVLDSIVGFMGADRATTSEVEWLVLRAYARGIADPIRSVDWRPQALIFDEEGDEARLQPLEHHTLRLFETPIEVGARGLRFAREEGDAHQAMLVLGALPEETFFPGPAELLFGPLEALDFPVDAAVWLEHIPNQKAVALTRRRVIDADNMWREEAMGDHGPLATSSERPEAARALEAYLTEGRRPPLLRGTISLALGADSPKELERRIEATRRAFAPVHLHRPLGEQLALWVGHLPGQPAPLRGYDDMLVVEQIGAMVPTATHKVGTDTGPYLGYTLSGSAQPVTWSLPEASASSRPPASLVVGVPGSGKTMLLQNLIFQSFLLGSLCLVLDPKGDHQLHRVIPPEHLGQIELSGDARYRGLLDPLVNGTPSTREDEAADWLTDVLPQPVPAEWKIAIRQAIRDEVGAEPLPTCSGVIARLEASARPEGRQAGKALAVYSDSGLAQLGFASPGEVREQHLERQVTTIRIRNLSLPLPGTPRPDMTEGERISEAVMRMVALYAMRLMSADKSRHKTIGLDEAFLLLQSTTGRRMIETLSRWARSENASPILITHLIPDAAAIENLIGARFVMGMESDEQAAGALELLHLDPSDQQLRQRLTSYRRGRCMLRDLEGRVGAIQVEIPDARVLDALDTTPGRPRPAIAAGEVPDAA